MSRSSRRSSSFATTPRATSVIHALRSVSLTASPGHLLAVRAGPGAARRHCSTSWRARPADVRRVLIDGRRSRDERGGAGRPSAAAPSRSSSRRSGSSRSVGGRERRDPLRLVRRSTRAGMRVSASCSSWSASVGGPSTGARAVGRRAAAVAIARAWRTGRRILLADERPDSSIRRPGHVIMLLLRDVVRTEGVTAIVRDHDP